MAAISASLLDVGTILAILNLCNVPMPPIKFRLNLTYGLGGDVVWRISSWPPWRPSWISERNDYSNSDSLSLRCFPSSFGSIRLTVWEMSFEEFQDGRHLGYCWISEKNYFSNSESLSRFNAAHQVFAQSDLRFWKMSFVEFQEAAMLDIGT